MTTYKVAQHIYFTEAELRFDYARSSGPGGQKVNKSNTKAILFWALDEADGIPEPVKDRFLAKYGRRVSSDGVLVLSSERHRNQKSNQRDCLQKLTDMLLAVAKPPKKRRPTKPTKASKEKRISVKKSRGDQKKLRQKVTF